MSRGRIVLAVFLILLGAYLLKNSAEVVLAVDEETGAVIGFINAVSDGVLSAYIPLLEVLPEYRGRGIGRALVKQMLEATSRAFEVRHAYDGAGGLQAMRARRPDLLLLDLIMAGVDGFQIDSMYEEFFS